MRYLCLIYGDSAVFDTMSKFESDAMIDAHLAYDHRLREDGRWIHAEALQGSEMAKVVRMRNGTISATDGPFAETKEQIGGFYLIEAATLEEAIDMAGHIPSARLGSVEIRPVRDLIEERHRDEAAGQA
jgi:hypothetical protein